MTERADLLQGTLDLLILKTLVLGPLHGWGISKQIRSLSADVSERKNWRVFASAVEQVLGAT